MRARNGKKQTAADGKLRWDAFIARHEMERDGQIEREREENARLKRIKDLEGVHKKAMRAVA